KPVAMGGPAANITAVMTNQVDIGWSAPPFGLDQLDKGDIRMIATGNDAVVFMYHDPKAIEIYSSWLNITPAKAKRTRDEFFKWPAIDPDKIVGLDQIVKDAVDLKFTEKPLTKEQLADLIRIPAPK